MENHKQVSRAAGVVGSMTLLSRIFGFLRDMVIATMFGSSVAADAFFVAFRIPNLQRRVLGEGAMTAAYVPVFSEYLNARDEKEAWNMTSKLFTLLSILLLTFTLLIVLFAPYIIAVVAPGFNDEPEKFGLTVTLTRWMAPYLIFIGLGALCMGILNTCKVFALPAAAPTLLNICMILSALLISPHMDQPILGLAIGVLLGGVCQLAVQLPETMRKGLKFTLSLHWRHPGILKIGKLMTPAIFGLGVYEINIMVDTILASLLPGGSISYLYYGNRLVQLPQGIFGVALGVAILPMLSEHAAKKEISEFRETLAFGIRLILFITVPATVGLIILSFPIVNTLWERGEFTRAASEGTAIALVYFSIGLCAYAGSKVLTSAYYSLQDTKTPAKLGIYTMLLNIVFSLILMGPLKHGGLALSTSLAAMINTFLLIYFLKKKLGRMGGRKILVSSMKLAVAAVVMGIVIYFFNRHFFTPLDSGGHKVFILTSCILIGLLSFVIISHLLKNEEQAFVWTLLRRKK